MFLTAALTDYKNRLAGYNIGAVDYILKPVDPEVLCAKVSVFVELFRKNQKIQMQAATGSLPDPAGRAPGATGGAKRRISCAFLSKCPLARRGASGVKIQIRVSGKYES